MHMWMHVQYVCLHVHECGFGQKTRSNPKHKSFPNRRWSKMWREVVSVFLRAVSLCQRREMNLRGLKHGLKHPNSIGGGSWMTYKQPVIGRFDQRHSHLCLQIFTWLSVTSSVRGNALQAELGRLLTNYNPLLIPIYMTKIVVSNVIHYITHFR